MPNENNSPDNRKPWFKLWSREYLEGSLRFDLTPEERSVWADFLCLANESRTRGVIQANNQMAYPNSWIADRLNIPLGLLERCLKKFTEQKRIKIAKTGITICNFNYYNSSKKKGRGRPSKQQDNRYDGQEYDNVVASSPEDVKRVRDLRSLDR